MRTSLRIAGAVCGALVLGLIVFAVLVWIFGWHSDVLWLDGRGWVVVAFGGGGIGVAVMDRWYKTLESSSADIAVESERKEPRL